MHTTTRTAPPLHSSGRDFCCIIAMHLLLLLNLTYLDVTLHKNIKHDRMYVHTFQHAPSNLEYDFLHTITHTHMNNISKLQWPLHIQIKFVELCLSEKLYSGIRSDFEPETNVWPFETFHGLFHWLLTSYKLFMHRKEVGFRCRSLSSVGPVFNITENVVSSFRRVVFAADSTYAFWRRHSTPVFCYLVNIYFSTTSMLQGICLTNIPSYSLYITSAILWNEWFRSWPGLKC